MKRCVIFCLLMMFLLTSCGKPAVSGPRDLVCRTIITSTQGTRRRTYVLRDQVSLQNILLYLRSLTLKPAPEPPDPSAIRYRITTVCTSGRQRLYIQQGDHHFLGEDGMWKQIDPEQTLSELLSSLQITFEAPACASDSSPAFPSYYQAWSG